MVAFLGMGFVSVGFIAYVGILSNVFAVTKAQNSCSDLLPGQYFCAPPQIDEETQEPVGCTPDDFAPVSCSPLKGITCDGKTFNGSVAGFQKQITCRYTNGYYYTTALGLSIFLGWLGADRFYLGYPALGLLKLCTCGIFGIGAFFDFLLIALQVTLPADGSNYIIDLYGPRIREVSLNNETYYKPHVE